MKFGKEFGVHLQQTLPEWKNKYLCYKPLKKLLKNLPPIPTVEDVDDHPQPSPNRNPTAVNSEGNPPHLPPHLADIQQWFVRILNEELDKFNDFYVDKQEEFVIRFQVDHMIREEKMIAAYDLIEIYCELTVARLAVIESHKSCPIDLKEAITSVIFAAHRCSDIRELVDARKNFTTKYGKDFVSAALELCPDNGVNRMFDFDDGLDPVMKEQLDREVEDFARRLNSVWPKRLREWEDDDADDDDDDDDHMGNVDQREALENLDFIYLCLDEIVDGGMILETDGNMIAGKVATHTWFGV
ncbi:hypothetical protein L2E82_45668 [Cichorium intybus]|uniref:Uncharacterized protein n=1 Tax=Cichorium intybus TaxID=13427 RepID=A0ACB8ZU70_CICIN|nr:hypothetical protein L2E82_45668 [Cichorium intybus]